jgi:hypothetical protein
MNGVVTLQVRASGESLRLPVNSVAGVAVAWGACVGGGGGVLVGGRGVFVGALGAAVLVGGTAVAVGGTLVAVAAAVAVLVGMAVSVGVALDVGRGVRVGRVVGDGSARLSTGSEGALHAHSASAQSGISRRQPKANRFKAIDLVMVCTAARL